MRTIVLTSVVAVIAGVGGFASHPWIVGAPKTSPNPSAMDLPADRCVVINNNPFAELEKKRKEEIDRAMQANPYKLPGQ